MAMHVRTKGSLRQNLRLLLTLFESKPHIIIIFHLKTNRQKLEKYRVNRSQTRTDKIAGKKTRLRTVRGSDYSPAVELSEQKDKLVTENWRD